MTVNLHGSDPIPTEDRRDIVERLVSLAEERLGADAGAPWHIVSFHSKMTKTIFEVEDGNGRRLVGKVSKSDRAAHTWQTLRLLWDAGMRPPSKFTVTEPVAWFPDHRLLLQEKAPGNMLLDLVSARNPAALEGTVASAEWIRVVQSLDVPVPAASDLAPAIERCRDELSAALPDRKRRIRRAADALLERLPYEGTLVPSHGDFHPMNVFLSETGRLTAIDLDTFAGREPAADVAYFAAQLAIMGYLALGDFGSTSELRSALLRSAPAVPAERVDLHSRIAFLRTLHYDICILKLGSDSKVEPFLRAAESGLFK
jgi:hypothetical protein